MMTDYPSLVNSYDRLFNRDWKHHVSNTVYMYVHLGQSVSPPNFKKCTKLPKIYILSVSREAMHLQCLLTKY